MIAVATWFALVGLGLALVMCAYRAFKGPTVGDRVAALDAVSVVLIGLITVASMKLGSTKYLDFVLVLAVLSFASTVAFAKYVERGLIIERDDR